MDLVNVFLVVAVPWVYQVIKKYADKKGWVISKTTNQVITFAFAGILTLINGGFAGIDFPVFPVWSGELTPFISSLLAYLGEFVAVLGLAWGALTASYEMVWDKLFVKLRLATTDKLVS
jgi:hypothetical protein